MYAGAEIMSERELNITKTNCAIMRTTSRDRLKIQCLCVVKYSFGEN